MSQGNPSWIDGSRKYAIKGKAAMNPQVEQAMEHMEQKINDPAWRESFKRSAANISHLNKDQVKLHNRLSKSIALEEEFNSREPNTWVVNPKINPRCGHLSIFPDRCLSCELNAELQHPRK